MSQVHIVIRRINPALKIDLAQVGRLEEGRFESIPLEILANSAISNILKRSEISDSLYVDHSSIPKLIAICEGFPDFRIEFFDNTLILMFYRDLDRNESATKEEGEGH
jgi:hypothetical protein